MKKLYESKSQEAEQADFTLKKAKPNENTFATRDWDKVLLYQRLCNLPSIYVPSCYAV